VATGSDDYPYTEKRQITALVETLTAQTKRDPMHNVRGIAVPVLGAVIERVGQLYPNDPVVQSIAGVTSPERIASGEPVLAADALLVAQQLDATIGGAPILVA
jgi:hypothetical protein